MSFYDDLDELDKLIKEVEDTPEEKAKHEAYIAKSKAELCDKGNHFYEYNYHTDFHGDRSKPQGYYCRVCGRSMRE